MPGSCTIVEAAGATYVASLPDFLSQCDVVSVHIPLSDATRHFISTEQFAHFKDGARLVNTARGPVVDEEALVQALKSGKVSAAGLDVFENEPKVHSYLLEADNVLLQPHTGVSRHLPIRCLLAVG
jgi:D-3-phosphoglycerate dehydrogenase